MGSLESDIPAAILLAVHIPSNAASTLPQILQRRGNLPALHPSDGQTVNPGAIYVAPPDRHMLLHEGRIQLTRGPRENMLRPAIDPLFRSAARAYGRRVAGVILSGALHDGTAGLMAIKSLGGLHSFWRSEQFN